MVDSANRDDRVAVERERDSAFLEERELLLLLRNDSVVLASEE